MCQSVVTYSSYQKYMWHNSLPSSQLCINMIGILYCDCDKTTRQYHYVGGREGGEGGTNTISRDLLFFKLAILSYVVGDREKYWLIGDSDLVITADIVMMVPHPLLSIGLLLNTGSVHQPNQPLEVVLCRIIKVINILNNIQGTLIVHLLYLSIN